VQNRIIGSAVVISTAALIGLLGTSSVTSSVEESLRALVLHAAGTTSPKPGEVRVPVLVDGVEYEVVGARPGAPKVLPLVQ
jgi:hypothetical protein